MMKPAAPGPRPVPEAVARLFRTDDGALLFAFLQFTLMNVAEVGKETSALHELNGRRRFALEILNMKDADLQADGRSKSTRRYISGTDA